MSDETNLVHRLPSHNTDRLAKAISRRLIEIERIFTLDLVRFSEGGLHDPEQFFSRNSGPTRFVFDSGVSVAFDVWGEQLSIIILTEPFEPDVHQRLYRLSESSDHVASLLGTVCHDVRIWSLHEDFETNEAMECTVSFLLEGGTEVFYCTWLHGDMDADYLLTGQEVPRDRVAGCYSVACGRTIALDAA